MVLIRNTDVRETIRHSKSETHKTLTRQTQMNRIHYNYTPEDDDI